MTSELSRIQVFLGGQAGWSNGMVQLGSLDFISVSSHTNLRLHKHALAKEYSKSSRSRRMYSNGETKTV